VVQRIAVTATGVPASRESIRVMKPRMVGTSPRMLSARMTVMSAVSATESRRAGGGTCSESGPVAVPAIPIRAPRSRLLRCCWRRPRLRRGCVRSEPAHARARHPKCAGNTGLCDHATGDHRRDGVSAGGLAAGFAGRACAHRFLRAALYEVEPTDPVVFVHRCPAHARAALACIVERAERSGRIR